MQYGGRCTPRGPIGGTWTNQKRRKREGPQRGSTRFRIGVHEVYDLISARSGCALQSLAHFRPWIAQKRIRLRMAQRPPKWNYATPIKGLIYVGSPLGRGVMA